MAITEWDISDRPREKLLSLGANALTDAELLAIFLRTGVKGKSAVDLARDLLTQSGSLGQLLGADEKTFCKNKGLGQAKYSQLQAVIEMSRRYLYENMKRGDALNNVEDVKLYLSHRLKYKAQEVFACLFLDNRHQVICYKELFFGTIDGASIYPREVVKMSLKYNAAAIIFAHNHPSGNSKPSQSDIDITKRLVSALKLVDVRVLDHMIIADEVSSLAAEGYL